MPVLVRVHQLPHQRHVFDIVDPHQQDRQIARHAMRPQWRGSNTARRGNCGCTALQRSRTRPQRRIAVQHMAGHALE